MIIDPRKFGGYLAAMKAPALKPSALRAKPTLKSAASAILAGLLACSQASFASIPIFPDPVEYSQAVGGDAHIIGLGQPGSFFVQFGAVLKGKGDNTMGQLGLGNLTSTFSSRVLMNGTFTQVAAGTNHSLALRTDGVVFATGSNSAGQTGDTAVVTKVWRQLATPSKVIQVAAGGNHTVFLTDSSELYGLGASARGQLGIIAASVGQPRLIASGVKKCFAAGDTTFYINTQDQAYALGANNFGQLGVGGYADQSTPALVASQISNIFPGGRTTFFLTTTARLMAAGENGGKYGNGRGASSATLLQVASDISRVSASETHTLFVDSASDIYVSGDNTFGQLGLDEETPAMIDREPNGQTSPRGSAIFAGNGYSFYSTSSNSEYSLTSHKSEYSGKNTGGIAGDGSHGPIFESAQEANPSVPPARLIFSFIPLPGSHHTGASMTTSANGAFTLTLLGDGFGVPGSRAVIRGKIPQEGTVDVPARFVKGKLRSDVIVSIRAVEIDGTPAIYVHGQLGFPAVVAGKADSETATFFPARGKANGLLASLPSPDANPAGFGYFFAKATGRRISLAGKTPEGTAFTAAGIVASDPQGSLILPLSIRSKTDRFRGFAFVEEDWDFAGLPLSGRLLGTKGDAQYYLSSALWAVERKTVHPTGDETTSKLGFKVSGLGFWPTWISLDWTPANRVTPAPNSGTKISYSAGTGLFRSTFPRNGQLLQAEGLVFPQGLDLSEIGIEYSVYGAGLITKGGNDESKWELVDP